MVSELDVGRAEAFAGRMLATLNDGMLSLMVSVGHRTGLFDTMAGMEAAASDAIAAAAGLQERYVREWLGAMTTGGIVEHDGGAGTYRLPPEHAASLTRAAGLGNVASMAQFVALLGLVEDDVTTAFRDGGGVPYERFPTFQRLMAEQSGMVFEATLLDVVVPLVPGLGARLEQGIDVVDVACGSGHAVNLLAEAYPASRFVGYDISAEGVAVGTAEAAVRGLANARFEQLDVASLSGPPRFDLVTTFDAVHDQAHPARVLRGIADVLRSGGTYLCVDVLASSDVAENVDHPLGPFLYTVSCMHCMTVSLAHQGDGLGAVWGKQKALEMLAEAGFTDVRVETVPGDIVNAYYVATKA